MGNGAKILCETNDRQDNENMVIDNGVSKRYLMSANNSNYESSDAMRS